MSYDLKTCERCKGLYPGYQLPALCIFCRMEDDPMAKKCERCGMLLDKYNFPHPVCIDIEKRVKSYSQANKFVVDKINT